MNSVGGSLAGAVLAGGYLKSVRLLTSGTIFQPSPGTAAILVELVGGGGGGGGAAETSPNAAAAGGGGGAGYSRRLIKGPLSSSYTYAIGAAGTGASAGANNGGVGGTTSFSLNGTTLLQATGGQGGIGCSSKAVINTQLGGAGGVGTFGDLNLTGSLGRPGIIQWDNGNSHCAVSGNGGNSGQYWGVGGIGIVASASSANGNPGLGYGGGGSGGAGDNNGTVNQSGGAGSAGAIFIWEFASEPYDKIFGINNPSAKYGRLSSFQYLTNAAQSTTYTATPGTKSAVIEVIGAGGGAGGGLGNSSRYAAGGGGGGGGYCRKFLSQLSSTYAFSIGTGGQGGNGVQSPAAGGNTWFGSANLFVGVGGSAGNSNAGGVGNNAVAGASGGTGTGGDLNLTGGTSEPGRVLVDSANSQCVVGGEGAASPIGGAISGSIRTTTGATAGSTGLAYGGGGSGGVQHTSATAGGGAGGAGGAIIVWEFA